MTGKTAKHIEDDIEDVIEDPTTGNEQDDDEDNTSELIEDDEDNTEGAAAGQSEDGETDDEPVLVWPADDDDAGEDSPELAALRAENQELVRRVEEMEAAKPAVPEEPLGERPKLEDYDYDAEAFAEALVDWGERKRAHDAKAAEAEARRVEAIEAYRSKYAAYTDAKRALGKRDFDQAEARLIKTLDIVKQNILLLNSHSPERLVYALGKNPKVAEKLAGIKDAAQFAFELGRMEAEMKAGIKSKPKPERKVSGNAVPLSSSSEALDKLRAEAEKTGDYSKVLAFKAKMKRKRA